MPEFKPPYKWAMDDAGKELIGMAQRFGPYCFVVNTDKISRATAEDQGWNLWNDPKLAGKYGILESDDWNVFCICSIAGFDPFKVHTDEEVAKFTETAKRVFKGEKLVGDIATMNQALVSGEIDFYLTGGTYSVSPARADGHKNIRGITPKKGPMAGGKGGISWIEITSVVNNPQLSPLATEFLAYVQDPEDGAHRRLCRRHLQSRWRRWAIRSASSSSPRTNSTPSSGTASRRRWRARSSTTSCRTTTSCSTSGTRRRRAEDRLRRRVSSS